MGMAVVLGLTSSLHVSIVLPEPSLATVLWIQNHWPLMSSFVFVVKPTVSLYDSSLFTASAKDSHFMEVGALSLDCISAPEALSLLTEPASVHWSFSGTLYQEALEEIWPDELAAPCLGHSAARQLFFSVFCQLVCDMVANRIGCGRR